MATEPVPTEVAIAVPFCTRTTPLVDTLRLGPELPEQSHDGPGPPELDDESEPGGVAEATHGVAATATPMPSATANVPTRPMEFAFPMIRSLLVQ
jgi:hypothetical protein